MNVLGLISRDQWACSILIAIIKSNKQISASMLMSVSETSGTSRPSLYYISAKQPINTNNSEVAVKVLSGEYNMKIVTKKDINGDTLIYLKKGDKTPCSSALLLNNAGDFQLLFTRVSDENELEGSTDALLDD